MDPRFRGDDTQQAEAGAAEIHMDPRLRSGNAASPSVIPAKAGIHVTQMAVRSAAIPARRPKNDPDDSEMPEA